MWKKQAEGGYQTTRPPTSHQHQLIINPSTSPTDSPGGGSPRGTAPPLRPGNPQRRSPSEVAQGPASHGPSGWLPRRGFPCSMGQNVGRRCLLSLTKDYMTIHYNSLHELVQWYNDNLHRDGHHWSSFGLGGEHYLIDVCVHMMDGWMHVYIYTKKCIAMYCVGSTKKGSSLVHIPTQITLPKSSLTKFGEQLAMVHPQSKWLVDANYIWAQYMPATVSIQRIHLNKQ